VLRATLALVPPRRQVQMQVESSEVLLSPKQANALGLVINELAANALNHSGRVNEPLALWVRIRSAGDEVSLAVCDNGAGFPAEVLEGEARGVGLYLARTLIESDLLGSLRLYNERGAVAEVRFSVAADE
jgi:two-component sensor histidine kinase